MTPRLKLLCASALVTALIAGGEVGSSANAASVVNGSDLFTTAYLTQVESWLVNDDSLNYGGPLQFTNIYDKGVGTITPQAFFQEFHAAVDGKGPTIMLIEAIKSNQVVGILGGYNPQSWNSSNTDTLTVPVDQRTAFIFNLTTGVRQDQRIADSIGQYQTGNYAAAGPLFGYANGPDLSTGVLVSEAYCATPDVSCGSPGQAPNLLGDTDTTFFILGRFEVFTIQEAPLEQTPLPAALPLFASGLGALGLFAWRKRKA